MKQSVLQGNYPEAFRLLYQIQKILMQPEQRQKQPQLWTGYFAGTYILANYDYPAGLQVEVIWTQID